VNAKALWQRFDDPGAPNKRNPGRSKATKNPHKNKRVDFLSARAVQVRKQRADAKMVTHPGDVKGAPEPLSSVKEHELQSSWM
jgi:hypothetical protein